MASSRSGLAYSPTSPYAAAPTLVTNWPRPVTAVPRPRLRGRCSARIVRFHISEFRMHRLLPSAVLLTTIAASLRGQGADTTRRMAASSFATVEVHVNARPIGQTWYAEDAALTGPARIAISYGQPHARGRQIVGGLIPSDTVWRFGANTATTLHTDVDLTLGGLALPRGDYSLFLLHGGASWQLIVNNGTGQWGTD